MWFLFFFIFIPLVLFVGFYLFNVIVIFLINKIFHKKYSKSFLSFILSCFFLIFYFMLIMGGISYKYMDPQYYEFKRLCKDIDNKVIIYNKAYWEVLKDKKRIKADDYGCFYSEKLRHEICFGNFNYKSHTEYERGGLTKLLIKRYYDNIHYATQIGYNYEYFGLWLKGDEGGGWHWEIKNTLICEDLKNDKRH